MRGRWNLSAPRSMYQQSLEAKERVGDVLGCAQTWGNLGLFCEAQKNLDDTAGILPARTWSLSNLAQRLHLARRLLTWPAFYEVAAISNRALGADPSSVPLDYGTRQG